MKETGLKYQLLEALFQRLEDEKNAFEFGVGKHLQVQRLLAQLPDGLELKAYAPILAPLLCTTEKEQQRFYEIFAESIAHIKAVNTPVESTAAEPIEPSQKWLKWLLWLLGIPVLIGVGYLVYKDIKQVRTARPKVLKTIAFTIDPDSTLVKKIPRKELKDLAPITQLGMGRDSMQQVDSTRYGRYVLSDTLSFLFTADTLLGQDSVEVFLYDSLGHCATVLLNANIKKSAPRIAIEQVDSVTTAAYTPRFNPIGYPYQNDILDLRAEPTTAFEDFIAKNIHWLKPFFLLLAALLFWLIIKYRENKRRKLIAELESKVKPPYIWNIDIPDVENIALGEDYYSVLNKLRQRTADEYSRLDINETVKATIQNAGMIDFRYRQMTRPPEYLLLIDQQSSSNHQAQLFDYLYRAFREEEIFIERFFYDGDPRLCYNEAYPDGVSLKELQYRFYNARLLLIGNGYGLLSPYSGKLAKWTTLFSPWRERSILSPRPTGDWGRREEQLGDLFHVLPASLQGLDFLVDQLDAGEDANFAEWVNKINDAPHTAITFKGDLIASLQQYYRPELMRWIAACAVYPALHWDLTLYLGHLLSSSTQPLLTVDNLMEINRLPWMVQGDIPPQARAVLIDWLEKHHPDTLQLARERLQEVLQKNHPPQDSVAWEDYSMNIALNEWLITKNKQRKKELEREIAQKLEAGIEADFTVVKYLDRKRTPLDFVVPDRWKKYVHHSGRSGLGWKSMAKDIGIAALLFLALAVLVAYYQPKEICDGEVVTELPFLTKKQRDKVKSLCINTPADRILFNEYLAREALKNSNFILADSLINDARQQVESLSDSVLVASISNLASDYYNLGVSLGNRADSLLQVQDTLYQSHRDSVCNYYFSAAYRLDSLNSSIKNAYRWCENPNVTYPLASFGLSKSDCCAPCAVEVINASRDASYYNWDFGNGETSQEARPFAPTYKTSGTYTIRLIARNAQATDTLSKTFEICDPTTDTDGDGVPDFEDNCPNEAGDLKNNGCPLAVQVLDIRSWQQQIEDIYAPAARQVVTQANSLHAELTAERDRILNNLTTIDNAESRANNDRLVQEFQVFVNDKIGNSFNSDSGKIDTNLINRQTDIPTTNTFTDSRDKQTYRTVTIGEQTWMAENLNYKTADSWCYLEMPEFCNKLGRLYTREAAKQACPQGWHLPSDEEWKTLLSNYGGEGATAYQALITGGSAGFFARLGGLRYSDGEFNNLTSDGYFWSSTEYDADDAWFYYFNSDGGLVYRINYNKSSGLSCRCLKD